MKELMELRFWMNVNRDHLQHGYSKEEIQFLGKTYHRATWTFEEHGPVTGHGFATDPNIAMTKAMVEALERLVVRTCRIPTTNGMAAHFFPDAALRSAKCELIERDSYLGHWYGNLPPLFIKSVSSEIGNISLYKLHSSLAEIHVTLAVIKYKDGHILGLGSSENPDESLHKATEEAGAIYFGAVKAELAPLPLKEFESRISHVPIDHIRWGLSKEAHGFVENWLNGNVQWPDVRNTGPSIREISWPLQIKAPPVTFMQASGKDFLQLFFGMPSMERSELSSLNRWNDRTILLPHTFG